MDKKFRLPKEFAEKWLTALRSGNFHQASFKLKVTHPLGGSSYCCLGIAGELCEMLDGYLTQNSFFRQVDIDVDITKVPKELRGGSSQNPLVYVLTTLNDGVGTLTLKDLATKYIIRSVNPDTVEEDLPSNNKLNFNQIADFIEDNCELYTE